MNFDGTQGPREIILPLISLKRIRYADAELGERQKQELLQLTQMQDAAQQSMQNGFPQQLEELNTTFTRVTSEHALTNAAINTVKQTMDELFQMIEDAEEFE
jgi:hypothetical protein